MKTKKLVFYALLLGIGLVLSYIESILPLSMGIPGAKLGLPNMVTVLLLYTYGALPAASISLLRIILSGFMFGNLFSIIYSISGFTLSFFVMLVLKKTNWFDEVYVSSAGGVAHNIGQLIAASSVVGRYVFTYLPVLIVAGVISGLVIGAVSGLMIKHLGKILPL